jgi:hypothetical protein
MEEDRAMSERNTLTLRRACPAGGCVHSADFSEPAGVKALSCHPHQISDIENPEKESLSG